MFVSSHTTVGEPQADCLGYTVVYNLDNLQFKKMHYTKVFVFKHTKQGKNFIFDWNSNLRFSSFFLLSNVQIFLQLQFSPFHTLYLIHQDEKMADLLYKLFIFHFPHSMFLTIANTVCAKILPGLPN